MSTPIPPTEPAHHAEYVYSWQLVIGTVQLFIAGPGADAWFPVTPARYAPEPVGTMEERKIAQAAVILLAQRFQLEKQIGPTEIRAALIECGWQPDEFTRYPKAA